ncbi:MAG TPA: DMT family transporter [Candidatus Saccharimonadales bacterium]|nr:DMT family transporter [Candidatus Saccharimonadales bacterium]
MGLLFTLIAIGGVSIGATIDKLNFSKNHISFRQVMALVFLAMSVSLLLFIIVTKQPFPKFSLFSFGLIALIALVSFAGNIFDYLSLKVDDLSLREPMLDFEPILAGLVGYFLFPAERRIGFLVAFILGAFVVYWGTHRRSLRKLQRKGMSYLLLSAVFYALLPSIYKVAMVYIGPAYISFFRVTAILLLTMLFFPVRKLHRLSPGKVAYSFSAGIFYALAAVAGLYAIKALGVVLTSLLMLLGPVLRYLASYFILKEKVRSGEVFASFLLVAVILVSIFI